MRKIKEVLRLHHDASLSERAIARSVNLSRDTVSRIISRASEIGLAWPLSQDIDDVKLEILLFPRPQGRPKNCSEPDWSYIHQEYRKKGVTLQLLWEEYKAEHSDGYQYSQFCERYRQWKKTLQISMRGEHRAGEKMFVDYAGPTIPYVDLETGEIQEAQIFVAVLGASSYTFVEAHPSQSLESFIGGHVRAFECFGGVPELIVPDNLKAGVKHPDRYEPIPNTTYHEMASHYGAAIMPARPLILDDWGLAPMTAPESRDLLDLMDDRFARHSTCIISQMPVEHWHEQFADSTVADAILDCLVHNAYQLNLRGESMRKIASTLSNSEESGK